MTITTGLAIVLGIALIVVMIFKYKLSIKYGNLELELSKALREIKSYDMTVDNLRKEVLKLNKPKVVRKPRAKKAKK